MREDALCEHASDRASWAQRVRPERRIHEMTLLEKAGYLWKYLASPRLGAPETVLHHFAEQRLLQEQLRKLPSADQAIQARIAFAGDIMWIRSHWNSFLPLETLRIFREFDGIVANLETMISTRLPVNEFLPDVLRFNSRKGLLTSFRDSSGASLFAALGLANNHVLDFGDAGALDTLSMLKGEGIATSGISKTEEEPKWTSFSRGGISFGFFSGCFGMNDEAAIANSKLSVNLLPGLAPEVPGVEPDLSLAERALREMQERKIDVKVVFLHWGSEFELYPTARTMKLARALARAGADFIVGSHPHVPQPMEIFYLNGFERQLPERLQSEYSALQPGGSALLQSEDGVPRAACVLYSMGNFVTTMYTFFCRSALLADVSFYRDSGTGRVHWKTPKFSYFYNQAPGLTGTRALLPMEEFRRSISAPTKFIGRIERKISFLNEHVGIGESARPREP